MAGAGGRSGVRYRCGVRRGTPLSRSGWSPGRLCAVGRGSLRTCCSVGIGRCPGRGAILGGAGMGRRYGQADGNRRCTHLGCKSGHLMLLPAPMLNVTRRTLCKYMQSRPVVRTRTLWALVNRDARVFASGTESTRSPSDSRSVAPRCAWLPRSACQTLGVADQHALALQPDPAPMGEVGQRFVDRLA